MATDRHAARLASMTSLLKGRRILLTGGRGFICTRLAERLARQHGAEVVLLVRPEAPIATVAAPGMSVVRADLSDRTAMTGIVQGMDAIVHLAFDNRSMQANLDVTAALADVAIAAGVRRFVHLGSVAVYEPLPDFEIDETWASPTDRTLYASIKRGQDELLTARHRRSGLPLVIIQPTIVYGPGRNVWTTTPARQLIAGDLYLPGHGAGTANVVYVDDVCQAVERALCAPDEALGHRILISGDGDVTWREFYGFFDRVLGTRSVHAVSDAELARLRRSRSMLARSLLRRPIETLRFRVPGNKRRPLPLPRVAYLPNPDREVFLRAKGRISIGKGRRLLGYEPRFSFAQGCEATAGYLEREFGRAHRRDDTDAAT